jgi:hypothetical protein
MKEFTLFWLNGKSELVYGTEVLQAIQSTVKKGRVVYYRDGNSINDYTFDKKIKFWTANKNVEFDLEFFMLEEKPRYKDEYGNTIRSFFIDDTGKNLLMVKQNNKLITLTLKLGKTKSRHIGTVTKSTRTIEMRRDISRGHLFRKGNAFGFGYYVLKNQDSIDNIRLSDDTGRHWKIPVQYVLQKGKFLHFKSQGFELQRFVSLEDLEKFIVHKEENRRF